MTSSFSGDITLQLELLSSPPMKTLTTSPTPVDQLSLPVKVDCFSSSRCTIPLRIDWISSS